MQPRGRRRAGVGLLTLLALAAASGCSSHVGPSAAPGQTTPASSVATSRPAPPKGRPGPTVPPLPPAGFGGHPQLKVAPPGSAPAQIAALFGPGFLPRSGGAFGVERIHRIPQLGPGGTPVLRVDYPAGSASPRAAATDDAGYGGAQAYLLLPHGPVDSLHLRYCVRFPPGFNFVKGGKLPGLFGGTVTSGQHIPDGTNGWSTRYMWRRGGAGEVYAYLPSSVQHGTSLGRYSWWVTPGRWQCLEQAVQLNTPGKADGAITVWLDGQQVYHHTDIVFRTTASLRIDGVFFSSFFGGGDASWASPTTQHADFADLSVGPEALSQPTPSTTSPPP
jgi:hypothetical protein